jgi:hypothetical protein
MKERKVSKAKSERQQAKDEAISKQRALWRGAIDNEEDRYGEKLNLNDSFRCFVCHIITPDQHFIPRGSFAPGCGHEFHYCKDHERILEIECIASWNGECLFCLRKFNDAICAKLNIERLPLKVDHLGKLSIKNFLK